MKSQVTEEELDEPAPHQQERDAAGTRAVFLEDQIQRLSRECDELMHDIERTHTPEQHRLMQELTWRMDVINRYWKKLREMRRRTRRKGTPRT